MRSWGFSRGMSRVNWRELDQSVKKMTVLDHFQHNEGEGFGFFDQWFALLEYITLWPHALNGLLSALFAGLHQPMTVVLFQRINESTEG